MPEQLRRSEIQIGTKSLWVGAAWNGVRINCGMAGEADLTPDEVEELIACLRELTDAP